ncbi:hypothetical protein GCM10027082_24130 [Comamonas humi]
MNIYYRGVDGKLHQFQMDTDNHRLAIYCAKQSLRTLPAAQRKLRPAGPVLAVINGGASIALRA